MRIKTILEDQFNSRRSNKFHRIELILEDQNSPLRIKTYVTALETRGLPDNIIFLEEVTI